MNSVKCYACGFVGWGGVEDCKKCGAKLMPHSASSPGQTNSFVNYQPYGRPGPQLKKGLAIASLVIGILNFFTLGLLGVGIVLGIVLALVALSKIKNNPSVYGGKEFATAGLITSILSALIIVPVGIIAAIAIPNLLAARRAANEGSAIHSLREVLSAESTYASVHGKYATLEELGAEQLINPQIAAGSRHGYSIRVEVSNSKSEDGKGFQVVAVPLTYPNSGRRSFYLDETGVLRGADARGGAATEFDDPLNIDDDDGYSSRAPTSRRQIRNPQY